MSLLQYSRVQAITGTTVRVNFPTGVWFVTEPAINVTIYGEATNVDRTLVTGTVDGAQVYTGVDLVFPSTAVGKRAAILVTGDG